MNQKEIKILDVGTGPGFFAILLAEAGYQVTAIDYTEEMLKEAQQNADGLAKCIAWKTGDAQALDVESNSFDANRDAKRDLESAKTGSGI